MAIRNPAIIGLAAAMVLTSPSGAAAGDDAAAEAGKKQFIRCVACHSMSAEEPAKPNFGPHLEGIVGRRAAAVAGYGYSDALRAQTFVWDEEQLDRWLQQPQADVPGLCMPFKGLVRPEDRKALIEYLKSP